MLFLFLLLVLVQLLLLTGTAAADNFYLPGQQQPYTLTHEVRVTNSGSETATDITVEIPLPDSLGGLPYCQSAGIEYDPAPSKIIATGGGHRAGVFYIASLPAGGSVTLTQRYALRCQEVAYTFNRAAVGATYSDDELVQLAASLSATPQIQSESEAIAEFTAAHQGSSASLYQIARQLFAGVNQYLDYDATAADQSALAVLERKRASCEGYVNLYLACLRNAGVACRQVSGYLYQPSDTAAQRLRIDGLRHTWVEFYLPDCGWIPADPTFTYTFEIGGQESKFVDWNYFANISADRRYLAFRVGETAADKIRLLTATGGRVTTEFSAGLTDGFAYRPFDDIDGHWAEDSILFCAENGLFQGVSLTSFAPEASMTRAMFVTVLGRLYAQSRSLPDCSYQLACLNDIKRDAYYSKYLAWAVDVDLVSGYGNGRFGPDDPVTREQMATIIASYLRINGYSVSDASSLFAFSDHDRISGWAVQGVATCAAAALLSGYPDGRFSPQSLASRAQVATIMQRLSNWLAAQERSAAELAAAEAAAAEAAAAEAAAQAQAATESAGDDSDLLPVAPVIPGTEDNTDIDTIDADMQMTEEARSTPDLSDLDEELAEEASRTEANSAEANRAEADRE